MDIRSKKESIKYILKYLKKYKKSFIIISILSLFVAVVQAVPAKITEQLFNDGFLQKKYDLIVIYAILFLLLHVLRTIMSIILNKRSVLLGQTILFNIRKDIYKNIMSFSLETYTQNNSGYINARIKEIDSISDLFSPNVFNLLASILEFIFISVILISINWVMYLVLLLPVPLMFIVIRFGMKKLLKKTEDVMEHSSKQTSLVNERIKGLEHIQTTGSENIELEKINEAEKVLVTKTIDQSITFQYIAQFVGFFSIITPSLLYIIGGGMFINNSITLGGILTFSMYMNRIYSPFLNISALTMTLEPALLAVQRIQNLFFNDENLYKSKNSLDEYQNEEIHTIKYENVSFSYKKQDQLISNLNFTITRGDILRIKGNNGTGKTTIVKLLLRLVSPDKGKILINNIDAEEYPTKNLRAQIAVVSQKIFLFDDTVRNNILYFCRNEIDKYNEISRKLSIENIYAQHNSDENMMIGENGVKLSGGEIQKIAIARALLSNAPVVIFDEANSNIDLETKQILSDIISTELSDKIVIIIDHSKLLDKIANKEILL